MTKGRIVIIPFLHGKLTADGKLIEPHIEAILEKWLERHPQFRGSERDYRIIRAKTSLPEGVATDLVRVTAEFNPDLADYEPAEDADLYEEFLAQGEGSSPTEPHKMWIEQFEAAEGIEDEFGAQRALEYLVGDKFLNFLEAAETNKDFRAEIPAFVAKIKLEYQEEQPNQSMALKRELAINALSRRAKVRSVVEVECDKASVKLRDVESPLPFVIGQLEEPAKRRGVDVINGFVRRLPTSWSHPLKTECQC